ncbi:MAG TPA: Crp/Fnr family transcriptional regulator [Candidatus Angelobacter sp.]
MPEALLTKGKSDGLPPMNPSDTFVCKNYSAGCLACRECALFFDSMKYLARAGVASQPLQLPPKQVVFAEGTEGDSVFYICSGRVKLAAVSNDGKEAALALLGPGDFAGDACLADHQLVRNTTATTLCDCCVLRIHRSTLMRVMQSEPRFLQFFLSFVMARTVRLEEDLVHHHYSSTEQRLARALLLLADINEDEDAEVVIPKISHEILGEMVGTTRARTTIFMNRFREQGLIDYESGRGGELLIRSSLFSAASTDKRCEHCSCRTDASTPQGPKCQDPTDCAHEDLHS